MIYKEFERELFDSNRAVQNKKTARDLFLTNFKLAGIWAFATGKLPDRLFLL